MGLECMAGAAVCLVVLILRRPLMTLFTTDADIVEQGVRYFNIIAYCYWLPCLTNGIQGYFRGMGRITVTLFGTVTQISVRVAATLLLVPVMLIPGVGLACVLGWTALLAWEVPLQRRVCRAEKGT